MLKITRILDYCIKAEIDEQYVVFWYGLDNRMYVIDFKSHYSRVKAAKSIIDNVEIKSDLLSKLFALPSIEKLNANIEQEFRELISKVLKLKAFL